MLGIHGCDEGRMSLSGLMVDGELKMGIIYLHVEVTD